MPPFKLKFRMGSSRSTSQEHEPDPQVNEALLNHQNIGGIGASSSTIDSVDCNSLVSLNVSERKLLLPNKNNILKMGFINQNQAKHGENIPTTPPPTYECVLEEQRQLAANTTNLNDDQLNALEHLSLNEIPCTDPNCREILNTNNNETTSNTIIQQQQQQHLQNHEQQQQQTQQDNLNNDCKNTTTTTTTTIDPNNANEDERKESIDSQEFLLGDNMTDSSSDQEREQLANSCSGNCQQYNADGQQQQYESDCQQYNTDGSVASCSAGVQGMERNQNNDFYDPLMNHNIYCNDASHYEDDYQNEMYDNDDNSVECTNAECSGNECSSNDHFWNNDNQQTSSQHNTQYDNYGEQQQQPQQHQYYQQSEHLQQTPEIISNKSSKEIYKDLAKEWGITCKMSDGCRCMECQGHYFDCEYDDNEHQKTDGGLGAGTPMFLSEVMHGTACNIL